MSRESLFSRCCLFGTVSIFATGVETGLTTAGGVLGAAILNAAGWTANGTQIVTMVTVAGATAVGTAVIAGPIACCAAGLMTCTGQGSDRNSTIGLTSGALISDAVLAGGFGATGAAMLGLSKLQIGYTAAAAAAGTGILVVGVALVGTAVGGIFACALCCDSRQSSILGSAFRGRRSFAEPEATDAQSPEPFTFEEIYASPVREDGTVNTDVRIPVLNEKGEPLTVSGMEQLPVTKSVFPQPSEAAYPVFSGMR